jgi:hypothetical protein
MRVFLAFIVVLALAGPAMADWDPGDGHKMHYPQMPDPYGWDVNATYYIAIADDWMCSGTGPVEDIHVWGSWRGDLIDEIEFFHVAIWSDVPDPDGDGPLYSHPGDRLWHYDFYPGEWTERYWGDGVQGWYDPVMGEFFEEDHYGIYQYNFEVIPDPFIQEEGQIYWLEVSAKLPLGSQAAWGWKTTLDHWIDDATWHEAPGGLDWWEIRDPITGESLDMAFVITPAPGTLALLGVFGLLGCRRGRRE